MICHPGNRTMNTKTDRFQLPEMTQLQLETAYLLDGTPVDFQAFSQLASSLETELAALETQFADFVTPQSQKKTSERGR